MLVLTRYKYQQILIGGDVVLTFLGLGSHGELRVGIDAPDEVRIVRPELGPRYQDLCNEITNKEPPSLSTKSVGKSGDNQYVNGRTVITKKKVRRWGTSRPQQG